jgi:transcription elongation factor GreA
MTVRGHELLRAELERLKSVVRPEITRAIAEARAHGDLRENAEYHAAKDQQGFVEARIREIEGKLGAAMVIDVTKIARTERVVFGATVTLVTVEEETRVVYRIVGEDEADLREGTISVNSPLARAMVGKSIGDTVHVTAPGGRVEYEILAVDHL